MAQSEALAERGLASTAEQAAHSIELVLEKKSDDMALSVRGACVVDSVLVSQSTYLPTLCCHRNNLHTHCCKSSTCRHASTRCATATTRTLLAGKWECKRSGWCAWTQNADKHAEAASQAYLPKTGAC